MTPFLASHFDFLLTFSNRSGDSASLRDHFGSIWKFNLKLIESSFASLAKHFCTPRQQQISHEKCRTSFYENQITNQKHQTSFQEHQTNNQEFQISTRNTRPAARSTRAVTRSIRAATRSNRATTKAENRSIKEKPRPPEQQPR